MCADSCTPMIIEWSEIDETRIVTTVIGHKPWFQAVNPAQAANGQSAAEKKGADFMFGFSMVD